MHILLKQWRTNKFYGVSHSDFTGKLMHADEVLSKQVHLTPAQIDGSNCWITNKRMPSLLDCFINCTWLVYKTWYLLQINLSFANYISLHMRGPVCINNYITIQLFSTLPFFSELYLLIVLIDWDSLTSDWRKQTKYCSLEM